MTNTMCASMNKFRQFYTVNFDVQCVGYSCGLSRCIRVYRTVLKKMNPPPSNTDAKLQKLPAFLDEKDELDSYLLLFKRYADDAKWENNTWAIKLSVLL